MAASHNRRCGLLPTWMVFLIASHWLGLPECRSGEPDGTGKLQSILRIEAKGQHVDRREALGPTNRLTEQGMWHAGVLPARNKAAKFEELKQDKKTLRYLEEVKKHTRLDLRSHIELARWCQRNDEPLRAEGHWHAVLASDANNALARNMLGHQLVDSRWFSQAEIQGARQIAVQRTRDLKKWSPRVERIAEGLASNTAAQKLRALTQLEKIDSVEAIAAFELAARYSGQTVFVDKLASYGDPTSCQALARLAIDDSPEKVQAQAIKKLSSYPADFYVPDLLGQISTPIQASTSITVLPNGSLALHQLALVETSDRTERHGFTKEFRQSNAAQAVSRQTGVREPSLQPRSRALVSADEYAVSAQALDEQAVLNSEVEALVAARRVSNERVFRALRSTLGVNPGSTANAWWAYWMDQTESYVARKPVVGYERLEQSASTPDYEVASLPSGRPQSHECLVKGTLVQTSTGLKAVEQIAAGELVLSQHIESGQLSLKPVLAATVRPVGDILSIDLVGDTTVQATPGHGWFVSGKGWVRSKSLKPGMMIHTARGNIEVQSVTLDTTPQETFNLIVADTHTYFVGEQRLLSYDNTPIVATARPVPGYGRMKFASK